MATSKVFSLEGKGLKLTTAEDIEPHIQPLKDNADVEEVIFVGNTLGVEASEALAKVLETKKNLKVANFADIFTSRLLSEIPQALSSILTALLNIPNLHTINLSDNAFGLNTQAPLVAFISAHVPLQHLILNNNGLGPAAGVLVADALSTLADKKAEARQADASATIPDLETVICGRNRLENGSMEAWAKAYSKHDKIRLIKMVQNGIRQEGITHLLKHGLRTAEQLRVLDLQDNTFTAMGARALADVVGGWAYLRELGVGDCLLSKKGGVLLGKALARGGNKELEILRLQYNEIDAKGLESLANATVDALPKLRRFEINGNRFSEDDESIEKLREAFDERKEAADPEFVDALPENEEWGLDELDELDDESDEEEGEDEDEDEEGVDADDQAERVVKRAEEAEQAAVAQEKDKSVDALADMLDKTAL
ncbi:uncharacterized protein K452DRAFT_318494 [Aplosporella prunicola CBS 121167]|uniref:Ran-GTPase activating protein 1 C-terminal domain-containing protein n=1 Tax=Aplosporella prunicola CBS 121167 TaxID=1176127 RepID=A0A6A6BF74_9PEZI|nr:uncharacterized protein K452DRAFT_318494 [Aplosporella prunicola CBS 121167]KAF2142208.1 hypothetical protein K452DRAFT_318494 [Aplosporella prunicola CBS 121167]